ncbi:hypothetical protein T484DRAFT_1962731 [Baffinella frigidus]|nr:hypothetical protein T484DRAFT_1962731 [Cryptophyta sp. CCMP2293]
MRRVAAPLLLLLSLFSHDAAAFLSPPIRLGGSGNGIAAGHGSLAPRRGSRAQWLQHRGGVSSAKMESNAQMELNTAAWKEWGTGPLSHIEPVFRPPAEHDSFILQATNGCSWNRCTFCEMYKADDKKFKVKNLDLVEEELKLLGEMSENNNQEWPLRVFLADGDALALPFGRLRAILLLIKKYLPGVRRVSSYCLPRNLNSKSVAQLTELKGLGLHTLYVGCESGDDEVLRLVAKGETFQSSLTALNKIHEAGLRSSIMILHGLGGEQLSAQHAENSARLVNAAGPALLSTLVVSFPLGDARFRETFPEFTPLSEPDGLLAEMEAFMAKLDVKRTVFRSDHNSNLLALAGSLPKDKEKLLAQIREVRGSGDGLRPKWMRRSL